MFGPHVYKSKEKLTISENIVKTVNDINNNYNIPCKTVQIFIVVPQSLKLIINQNDVEQLKRLPYDIFVHSSYLDSPWKINNAAYAIGSIKRQLQLCGEFNSGGLVIHLPKIKNNAIDIVANIIEKLIPFIPTTTKLYLENPAVDPLKADPINWSDVKHIKTLLCKLSNTDKIGICFDTAHLWASGIDIQSANNAKLWLKSLDGINNILFHLNDNLYDLNSGRDKHALLGEGKIWSIYKNDMKHSGAAEFIKYAYNNKINTIFEHRPSVDINYLTLLQIIPQLQNK